MPGDWIAKSLTISNVLMVLVIGSWIAMMFLKYPDNETLRAVVMIIVGYVWGSSTGSKAKDAALLPPQKEGTP